MPTNTSQTMLKTMPGTRPVLKVSVSWSLVPLRLALAQVGVRCRRKATRGVVTRKRRRGRGYRVVASTEANAARWRAWGGANRKETWAPRH